ncbi:uncharacterized protein LOC108087948 [Drosophila ficusphila]|uniref:uncharacterized protein LOC108087948 n=1 Tax=Drosophila ficusphila TaxID=30025 RepID=UPI0007E6C1F6|nr:uncharacterized protein LOC108087948 [Drosophila ficusphila]
MSWLSKIFGLIFIGLFIVFVAAHPRWEQLARVVAERMNVSEEYRIQEAWKAVISVDTQLHEYFHRKLGNDRKTEANDILNSAYAETNACVREFYAGGLEDRFRDCIRHVTHLHMDRLKSQRDKNYGVQQASGASRLKIWH